MTTAAIIQLALALLPLVQVGIPQFIAWIESLRATLKQTGEWTDQQEVDFRAVLFAKTQDPAYQPD